MPGFQPLYLGNVMRDAEAIRGMRNNAVTEQLQQEYLRGNIARAPAQEARAAAQDTRAQQSHDAEQRVHQLRILNTAAAEISSNPGAASRWLPQLKAAGLPVEQLGALDQNTAKQLFASTTEALKAYQRNNSDTTNTVQSTHILENGNIGIVRRDGTIQDTGQKAKPQMFYGEVGGVPTVTRAFGQGATTTPLSTVGAEADAAGQVAGAQAAARTAAESAGAREQKAPALATLEYVADQFSPMIEKTAQGGPLGVIGRAGTVFDYEDATRFDNLREQLSTELRTVFRIPGEGTLSDREQAQYGLQLPNRNYSPAVNKAILEDVRTRASMRVGMGEPDAGSGQWSIRQVD